MTLNEAIRRIERCLAMTTADNEHEAQAAYLRARDLMRTKGVAHVALSAVSQAALAEAARRFALQPASASYAAAYAARESSRERALRSRLGRRYR